MAWSALINNPRYNPSKNGVQTKKNDPSERTERVIFVSAAEFLRPAGGFVKRLEQFRETPCSGLSVNSPTFSSAAAYTAAYTFSDGSLHTPHRTPPRVSKRNPYRPSRRPPPRQPNRTPSRKPRHENPCRQPLRLVRCSPSDVPLTVFPADSRPEPRLVCRTGRANRYGVRRGRRPEARLGVRWGSLRASLRFSTRVPFRARPHASESDTLAGAVADTEAGYGAGTLNVLRDRCM